MCVVIVLLTASAFAAVSTGDNKERAGVWRDGLDWLTATRSRHICGHASLEA